MQVLSNARAQQCKGSAMQVLTIALQHQRCEMLLEGSSSLIVPATWALPRVISLQLVAAAILAVQHVAGLDIAQRLLRSLTGCRLTHHWQSSVHAAAPAQRLEGSRGMADVIVLHQPAALYLRVLTHILDVTVQCKLLSQLVWGSCCSHVEDSDSACTFAVHQHISTHLHLMHWPTANRWCS